MNKKLIAGLAIGTLLLCGLETAFATPTLVGSATWISDGVQHDYTLYSYSSGDNKDWLATSMWVGLNAPKSDYLATIASASENNFINSSFFTNTSTHAAFAGEVWLGGFQAPGAISDPAAGWNWITGEAWNYTSWGLGEANDYYGPGSEQYLATGWYGKWNDEGALGNLDGFLVESTSPAPVPEPTTMLLFGTGLAGLAAAGRRKRN
jgi:hypothetical protein